MCFVAIDGATRYVWVKVLPAYRRHGDAAIEEFLAALLQHLLLTILTR